MREMMEAEEARHQQDRDTLRSLIAQWNGNRLELFELTEPNDELEFLGVMRFYFQDAGQKVATKCIRVSSTATTTAVIETLIEKFRPDMRMLSIPEYALYEIHENGEERKLGEEEKPLLVQLNWHNDDREGRFLLRRIDEKSNVPEMNLHEGGSFKRKLSRREKKQLKKQEKMNRIKNNQINDGSVAEKLYTEIPETSFTRSISNPEAVMRRRRQQKLEKKLQQYRSKDGGPDTGGTLKIFGESLCKDVPYKTLLLSVRDSAAYVVREMLDKYGLYKEDASNYCLVQVSAVNNILGENNEYGSNNGDNSQEYILDDDDCPLAVLMTQMHAKGSIMFHVRRRPADHHPRKRKKKPQTKGSKGDIEGSYRYDDPTDRLPFLLELNPDGSEIVSGAPKKHRLQPNVTEVGSERSIQSSGQSLQLFGPNIHPRHCVIAHTEGIVTVTPCSRDAETYVNGQRIYETTILQHGAVVRFGRIHYFRFWDPLQGERARHSHSGDGRRHPYEFYDRPPSQVGSTSQGTGYETTFDVDGHVETISTASLKEETLSQKSGNGSGRGLSYDRLPRGQDPILPATLEFREETEDAFLHAIISDLDTTSVQFKLAPTYSLYMAARYRATTHYQPELTPTERAQRLSAMLAKVSDMVQHVVQEKYADPNLLAFWMANSSELLHFLKSDRQIAPFSVDAQEILAEAVQVSFRNLVSCLRGDLGAVMPHFLYDKEDSSEDESSAAPILLVLGSAMTLLRRCRVNAALTIQLFSQLFHFINMWAFNHIVNETKTNYCTREWGARFKRCLTLVEGWAEKQGLELAADCHLSRIVQAAHLLQAPKSSPDDIATISSTCFKLNSLQLRALLQRYQPESDEPRIPQDLIENVVRVAENTADELARSDGREVRLEEDPVLQLPFLLPEDGYSCEIVRGIPTGLSEFLAPLQHAGLCRMTLNPTSCGYWTIYMADHVSGMRSPSAMSNRSIGDLGRLQGRTEAEIQVMKLQKSNNGMGLSIVAAKGAGQDKLGIYIKSVVKGGAADSDGRLQAGDQLLKVDGQSLVGITQEKAAEYLMRTGPVVTLEVAKQGAIYHGLATLLSQPSPVSGRASSRRTRPRSEEVVANRSNPSSALPSSRSTSHLGSRTSQGYEERLVDWNQPPNQSSGLTNSRSSPSLSTEPAGFVGQNRINDKDSLLSKEQNSEDQVQRLPPHGARIQSAKSVPSLNSENVPPSPVKQHEVYNPGYSRTSSTNSIPQKTFETVPNNHSAGAVRSRSIQSLNDPRGYQSGVNSDRHPSTPTLSQQSHMHSHPHPHQREERFYQNVAMYRDQNQNGYPPPSPSSGSLTSNHIQEDRNLQQQRVLRGSLSSLHSRPSEPGNPGLKERPVSYIQNTGNHINQLDGRELQGQQGRSQSTRDILRQEAKMQEMQEEMRRREERSSRVNNVSLSMPGSGNKQIPGQPPRGAHPLGHNHHPHHYPADAYQSYNSPQSPHQQMYYQPNSPPRGNQPTSPNAGYLPMSPHHGYIPNSPRQSAPPTAPKPRLQPQGSHPQQRPHDGEVHQLRHPFPEDITYRNSPPPPMPPTSTHPLHQNQRIPQTINDPNRYSASMGEVPRAGYIPANSVQVGPRHIPPMFNANNPWEREEKEREKRRRQEAGRLWRDQQISDLEGLDVKTSKQEEQLRTLRLEREFQRRAEEMSHNEDDEEGEEEDDCNVERRGLLRSVQEDLERSRQRSQEKNIESEININQIIQHRPDRNSPNNLISTNGQWRPGPDGPPPNGQALNKEEEDRLQKVEEMHKKQRELDAAREVEERILREAQRRRDEDVRQQLQSTHLSNSYHPTYNPTQSYPNTHPATYPNTPPSAGQLRLDHLVANGPIAKPTMGSTGILVNGPSKSAPPSQQSPQQPFSPHVQTTTSNTVTSQSSSQRLDTLLNTPNNSYQSPLSSQGGYQSVFANQNSYQSTSRIESNHSSPERAERPTTLVQPGRSGLGPRSEQHPKRVSFHDSKITPDDSPTEDWEIEDPDNFLSEAESMLASPRSPDSSGTGMTPGVIGAQEVYRDPRMRRLQEQQQQKLVASRSPGPEKLTFKEKMKMFAKESGEVETPKDKTKISRAQREIEQGGGPSKGGDSS